MSDTGSHSFSPSQTSLPFCPAPLFPSLLSCLTLPSLSICVQVRRYRAQVREQSRRLLELRCSYEALQRQMTKQADQRPPLPMPFPHKHKQQQPPRSRSAGSRRQGQGEGAASASDIRASHKVLLNKRPVSASVRAL